MTNSLGPIPRTQKTGEEKFKVNTHPTEFNLLSFWQWSTSNLIDNTTRGILAEFIVAQAIGIPSGAIRTEWDAYDLETADGIKIEVKSSAYLQSWHQDKLSTLNFGIAKTKAWFPETNRYEEVAKRQSNVYVFAILTHKDKTTVDPLDLNQWQFYVLATNVLNERVGDQKTISLRNLERLCDSPVNFTMLKETISKTI